MCEVVQSMLFGCAVRTGETEHRDSYWMSEVVRFRMLDVLTGTLSDRECPG